MASSVALGVDIGGTKVGAGLISVDGTVLFKTRLPMAASGDASAGFSAVKRAIEAVLRAHPGVAQSLIGIGICSPGPLDPRTGVVINPPNLPCWRNFPLGAQTESSFGIPVWVDNDANAAALAETLWGAARGHENVFYATVGTGIGTGIVFGNRIYHGRTGSAAEGGHISIDHRGPRCACGKRGCIEALCSGPAIAQRARARLSDAAAPSSMLRELPGRNGVELTAEDVGEAFRAGDELARQVLEETSDLFTVWLGNVVDLLEPDVIVIGGGAGALIGEFFDRIRERLPHWSINQRCAEIPLVNARYGADAGIAGAAALCRGR